MNTFNVLYAYADKENSSYFFEVKKDNQYQWFLYTLSELKPFTFMDMGENYRIFKEGRLDFNLGLESNKAKLICKNDEGDYSKIYKFSKIPLDFLRANKTIRTDLLRFYLEEK